MTLRREGLSDKLFNILNTVFLIIMCAIVIYPLYYMLIVSISDGNAVLRGEVSILPIRINFKAYKAVLMDPYIPVSYWNTVRYTIIGTLINLVMTAMCAYPLSRKNLYGREIFTFIIIATMFFDAGIVSNFLVVKSVGLKNTMWAIVIPPAINVWYMVIMRTFFSDIPEELHESAYLDGANEITIFARIILPLSKPVIASLLLFYAVGHWNSFIPALIYLDDRKLFPMQLVLRNIVIGSDMANMQSGMSVSNDLAVLGKSIKYAVIFITIAPILMVYPFIQKYFATGIMVGALKG